MKKIIAVLFLMFLTVPFVKADENIKVSDEEIMSFLEKYDLNNEEKDLLFKEMKKKLEEGITEADIEKMMSQEEDNKKASKAPQKKSLVGEHSMRAARERREQARLKK